MPFVSGGREYTFYLAWVADGFVPWDLTMARHDENMFSLIIGHDETQIPTALVEIVNPRIGFISPSRLYWAWISFSVNGCDPRPCFFGRLFGIPEELSENFVRMKFISRHPRYAFLKQSAAHRLKTAPNYDELFLDVLKRDDPTSILEGWSAIFHVDRIDMSVTASDILLGEDGTVTFAPSEVFYDSLKLKILQVPLKAINVKMDVKWSQQYAGHFAIGQWAWPTIGTEPFIGDWPKSGASVGGGWHVGVAWAGERDPAQNPASPINIKNSLINQTPSQISTTYSWVNTAKKHATGDTMSVSINYTQPFGNTIVLKETDQFGIINPYNVDVNGDPDPINQPARISIDWLCYRTLGLNFNSKQALATLGMCYQADRKRSERLEMTVQSDVQPVLIDPLVVEDTDTITMHSGDLSLPAIDLLNWDTVGFGEFVEVGTIIFPDNPLVPGQTSSQVAVVAGHTGNEEPNFSNISGAITIDNEVTWASLGDTPPSEDAQDWVRGSRVALGTMIVPKPVSGVPDFDSLLAPTKLIYPPQGIPVAKYSIFSEGFDGPGATMRECTQSGLVGGPNQFGEPAQFTFFQNPTGQYIYMCVRAGQSSQFHPNFNGAFQVSDGSVIWQNIGPANVPIGGWPGFTPAREYFPTVRGQQSVQNGICRARAKLRKRARAVECRFETYFEVAAMLSCRMNGKVFDPRIPGSVAFGKVISYKLEAHDDGEVIGRVVLGCAIGNEDIGVLTPTVPSPSNAPVTDPGIPSYVANGYVQRGYQQYYATGTEATPGDPSWKPPGTLASQALAFLPSSEPNHVPPTVPTDGCHITASQWSSGPIDPHSNEIGYTPPGSNPNDDGIVFGGGPNGLVLGFGWHGTAAHITPNNIEIHNLQIEQAIHDAIAQANTTKQLSFPSVGGVGTGSITVPVTPFYDIQMAVQIALLEKQPEGIALWFDMSLAPVTNGPFSTAYVVETTPLLVQKGIDLSAPYVGNIFV